MSPTQSVLFATLHPEKPEAKRKPERRRTREKLQQQQTLFFFLSTLHFLPCTLMYISSFFLPFSYF
jgi:hypothetical protein